MLTNSQKACIQTTITPLLKLPEDEKKLSTEIARLRQIITSDDCKTKDNDGKLWQLIRQPNAIVAREKKAINIGEARKHILDIITQQINQAAERAHCKISISDWNKEALLPQIQTLSSAQKEFIQTITDDLLVLTDTNPHQLSQDIAKIKHFFVETKLEKNNDYAILRTPAACFLRLENQGALITMGEVKSYLLDHISQRITQAAEKAKLALTSAQWNNNEIKQSWIKTTDFVTNFETIKPRTNDGEPPYSVPRSKNQIYRAWIQTNELTHRTEINLEIQLDVNEKISRIIPFKPFDNFANEIQKDEFLEDTAEEAIEIVENETIDAIIWYLVREKIISYDDSINYTLASKILLTYKVYLNAIRSHKTSSAELNHLSYDEVEMLKNPVVRRLLKNDLSNINRLKRLSKNDTAILKIKAFIYLLKDRKCTPDDILSLDNEQKQLLSIPYYNKLVYDNKLKIDEIKKLRPDECKNLYLVPAVGLQEKNKVSFQQMRQLKPSTKKVICREFYYQLLIKDQLKFQQIESLDDAQGTTLSSDSIINLIGRQIISIAEALHLKQEAVSFINRDFLIRDLMNQKWLTVENVNKISHDPNQHSPMEKFAHKPLEKQHVEKFKHTLTDFCNLSSSRLLYENDLHYLIKHFSEIQDKLHYDGKKEIEVKSKNLSTTESGIPLLNVELIKQRCITNVRQRLQTIAKNALFKQDSNDSIEKLATDCKSANIDLRSLQTSELISIFESLYSQILTHRTFRILIEGTSLGFSPRETVQLLLGTRLFAIYEQLPFRILGSNDNITMIFDDLDNAARATQINKSLLLSSTIHYFLTKIKEEIEQALNIDSKATPPLYAHVHRIICQTEGIVTKEHDESKQHAILTTQFKQIMSIAEKAMVDMTLNSSMDNTVQRQNKRLKLTSHFFLPRHTLNSPPGMKEFCEKLLSVASFVDAEQRIELRRATCVKTGVPESR